MEIKEKTEVVQESVLEETMTKLLGDATKELLELLTEQNQKIE